MSWDPRVVDKAIYMQNLMMDLQKAQFKENPPAVKSEISNPVPPAVEPLSSSVRRSFERLNDPPATVVKFINESTKEVEAQIPSEVSIKIYKEMLRFMDKIERK